jgi:hypothetical protein
MPLPAFKGTIEQKISHANTLLQTRKILTLIRAAGGVYHFRNFEYQ